MKLVKKLLPFLLIIITLGLAIILPQTKLFTINTITCNYYHQTSCPDSIQTELNKYLGKSLIFTDLTVIKNRLISSLNDVKKIEVAYQKNNTINFTFSPLKPIATVKSASASASLIVLENYRLIDPTDTNPVSLPTLILYNQSIRSNDTFTDETIIFSLNLLNKLSSQSVIVKSCHVINQDLIKVVLQNNTQALFSSVVDLTRQVTSLQAILSKATMTTDSPIIDLRFEKPVIKPS